MAKTLPVGTALTTTDGSPAIGSVLMVTPDGVGLSLTADPGTELTRAVLHLSPVTDTEPLNCSLTTDQGAGLPATIAWLTAEWSRERPLAALSLTTSAKVSLRLKVYRSGAWVPLAPVDTFNGTQCRFPPVVTSKVMVEILAQRALKATDDAGQPVTLLEPSSAKVTGFSAEASKQPFDLQLLVADQPPVFRQAGALPPGGAGAERLEGPLNAALQAAGGAVPLVLKAAVSGQVKIDGFEAEAVTLVRRFAGGEPALTLPLAWGGEAVAQVSVEGGSRLLSLGLACETDLRAERALLQPSADPAGATRGQLCDAGHGAAQAFAPLAEGGRLTGADLWLWVVGTPLAGSLCLHADDMGRPAAHPLAELAFTLERAGAQWLCLDLPAPVALEQPWWLVLAVEQGEAHWALDPEPPQAVGEACYRLGEGPWLTRGGGLWGLSRLRVAAAAPAPPGLFLRRGKTRAEIALPSGPDGRVVLAGEGAFDALARTPETVLILVRGDAAGSITLRDLELRCRRKGDQ